MILACLGIYGIGRLTISEQRYKTSYAIPSLIDLPTVTVVHARIRNTAINSRDLIDVRDYIRTNEPTIVLSIGSQPLANILATLACKSTYSTPTA